MDSDLITFCSVAGFLSFVAIGTLIVDIMYTRNLERTENKEFKEELKNI